MIRVAVVYFGKSAHATKLKALSDSLSQGMQQQGAQVDVIPGLQNRDAKLSGYHYVAIGCDVRSLLKGALPPELPQFLATCGVVNGKKAFAFVLHSFLGADATLLKLMKALEHEGMLVRYSEVLAKPEDSRALGQRLKLS